MLPRANSTVVIRGALRPATRWASHNRTWLSDSLLTRTTSVPTGKAATDSTRPSSSQSRSPPASPGSITGRGTPSPRSRRSRPSRSSTAATAGLVAPVGTDPQCITGVTRDRTVPGNHPRSRKTRRGARFKWGPPVTWGGHGCHRHGGVPGHRQRPAGAPGMSIAFDVVFGVFVVAIVALAVIAIRWAVRRDRVARAKQAELRTIATEAPSGAGVAPGPPPEERTS